MVITVLVIYTQSGGKKTSSWGLVGSSYPTLIPARKMILVPRDGRWTEEPNILDEVEDGNTLCLVLGFQHPVWMAGASCLGKILK